MSGFEDVLKSLAPTIAGALSGPLAPLVVPFVAALVGQDKSTATVQSITAAISNTQLSGDQMLQLKKMEGDFKQHISDNQITLAQLGIQDVSDARDMQKSTKSIIPPTLAIMVTLGFFSILGYMMSPLYSVAVPNQPLLVMLGSLGTAWGAIMHFYFGSSTGSQGKDATIQSLSQ